MKKLYLIDISSLFFRAFYAIPPMHNEAGLPTNALYGFLSMVVKLLKDSESEYMVFCQDRKEASFRKDVYKEYKANRGEMPPELAEQMPYINKLTDLLGVPAINKKGYEADDIIGSLTHWGKQNSFEVVIVSGDKDFAQLIQPGVVMFDTMKNKTYDETGVIEKWGVAPENFIDYLALVGDSSDNIPGVKGVGPKSAIKLLNEFQTLDGIYESVEKVPGKSLKQKIIDHKEMAYLSKELVTIVTDLNLIEGSEDLKLKPVQREELTELLNELEFKSFEQKLFKSKNESKTKKNSKEKSSKKEEKGFIEEEWSLDRLKKEIPPYSELWLLQTDRGVYIAFEENMIPVDPSKEVAAVLSRKQIKWKGFGLKDLWREIQLEDGQCGWDAKLAAYVLKAGNIKDLNQVCIEYLGEGLPELPQASDYLMLNKKIEKNLKKKLKEADLTAIYEEMELPLVPVLYNMELNGIYVDVADLKKQSDELKEDVSLLEKEIHELAGESFNIASPKQLAFILFEKLELPVIKKTKTGYSTNSDVLQKLMDQHPICEKILEYRELTKLKSTYVDALPKLVNEKTGRVHTYFNQSVTTTGRLSSTHPNLQNIPIRTERGRLIRKSFKSEKDKILISADYSQIELRILAHITHDPGLCNAFEKNLDIHTATASEIYGVELEEVDSNLRRNAKAVNFGIAYGQGAYGLAGTLGISRKEASEIIQNYFEKFKNVKLYIEKIVEEAKEKGYVETLLGRRRYIPELNSSNGMLRKFGERAAINAPIQGSASDIVKKAMIVLYEEIDIPMLLQVHDEIIFECDLEEVDDVKDNIKEIMESAVKLDVPLIVNIHQGSNWDEAH